MTLTAQEAGRVAARYFPADPVLWLQQCALAGIAVRESPGGFALLYNSRGPEREQAQFLEAWLRATPSGANAVQSLLLKSKKK